MESLGESLDVALIMFHDSAGGQLIMMVCVVRIPLVRMIMCMILHNLAGRG